MTDKNYYNVTEWNVGNPYEDIGEVINSIIGDIKSRQTKSDINEGGKSGAVIYIPSGDYHLTTQVVIDISYLRIVGSGHGFTSSSIRLILRKVNGQTGMKCGREEAVYLWIVLLRLEMRNLRGQHFMLSGVETPA